MNVTNPKSCHWSVDGHTSVWQRVFVCVCQFPDGGGAVCGDGVSGRWITDRCGYRDLYGWSPDSCCLPRGTLHSVQPGPYERNQIPLSMKVKQKLNTQQLSLSAYTCVHICSVYKRWISCTQTRSFTETSKVTMCCSEWMGLSSWVSPVLMSSGAAC